MSVPLSLVLEPSEGQLFAATRGVLEAARAAPDVDAAIDATLNAIVRELGADRGFLLLHAGGGDTVVRAHDGGGRLPESEHEELSRTVIRAARESGRLTYWDAADEAAGGSLGELGIVAAIAVPLRVHDAHAGALYVDVRELGKSFGAAHERFVGLVAAVLEPLLHAARADAASQRVLARASGPATSRMLAELTAAPSMEEVGRELRLALGSRLNVLIVGESGTGKTALADALGRARGPVVRAMLGQSDDLNTITSELFGHVRGAFSGAVRRRVGLVEHADGGTLILDEVLNLPQHAQQLLLDLTQFGTYRPLGDDACQPRHAALQIVAVTNGDIDAAMAEGRFRRDLYHRLAGHVITVPPVRARRAELPWIAESVLQGLDPSRTWHLSLGVRRLLVRAAHDWPGNVRELEAMLSRALARARLADADAEVIERRHLLDEPALCVDDDAPPSRRPPPTEASIEARWAALEGDRARLADEERRVLLDALEAEGGVVSRVARRLGVPRTSLLHRLQLHDLMGAR